jgi:hypothetical protein
MERGLLVCRAAIDETEQRLDYSKFYIKHILSFKDY